MKRIVSLLLVLILLATTIVLSSCGNMSVGLGNYAFEHIHILDYSGHGYCATVEKWYDNSAGIEVKTEEYGCVYLSEGTYILFGTESDCPFCKTDPQQMRVSFLSSKIRQ